MPAQPASSASAARSWTRTRKFFGLQPMVSAVRIDEENLLEPLGGPYRARGAVEENVEVHRILLQVAPGPDFLVARVEEGHLTRLAEQRADLIARHAGAHPGKKRLR